ncbi:MAG: site-specific DNA-methyltransferase [Candidatus Izemoplasmatales bacterium]|nr:site-specific DNA-methyltransferase [Candidatus Izemoplasmatales bacterium]
MPTLEWIGKEKVINHHQKIKYRVLNQVYNFNTTKESSNLIINGDNLEVLKSLLPKYEGRVKVIYLDPPYNTGKENWVYNDNVNDPRLQKWLGEVVGSEGEDLSRHDKWLCMMYPRLKLIHKLLSDDGVIFMSIDNNEFENLKHISDEIFGENNFITNFAVENNPKGRKNNIFVAESYEYCLLYCKNKIKISEELKNKNIKKFFNNIEFDNDKDKRKIYSDEFGDFKQSKRQVVGVNKSNKLCSESNIDRCFTIYYKANDYKMSLLDEYDVESDQYFLSEEGKALIEDGYVRYTCLRKGTNEPAVPLYSKDTVIDKFNEHKLFFKSDGTIYEKDRKSSMQITSLLTNKKFGLDLMTESARALLERILKGANKFENPKNVQFIKALISLYPDNDVIVLDPFAGSGTTGHAVIDLNKEDQGNRKFILIEMMDYAESVTAKRIKNVIEETQKNTKNNFTFYTLGDFLFTEEFNLNKEVGQKMIRQYIYYMETKKDIDNSIITDNPYYLGTNEITDYYFYYDKDKVTNLNFDFLSSIKKKNEVYVIYADKCTISDRDLDRLNIVFKKIPRDISKL